MVTPTRFDRPVTWDWVLASLGSEDVTLMDARPFAAYAGTVNPNPNPPRNGHVPGAHNVFWQQYLVSVANPVLKDPEILRELVASTGARTSSRVVSYCFSGMLSSAAYFVTRYLGYDESVRWVHVRVEAEAGSPDRDLRDALVLSRTARLPVS
jgi:3-mercaptopyruvate sulfurtransferase SseA